MGNHWNDDGDLVVEEKTLFRQVGFQAHPSGRFYDHPPSRELAPGGYSALYQQIATWVEGEGWKD